MNANVIVSSGINQAFSSLSALSKSVYQQLEHSHYYETFLAPLLGKMTMCNITMKSLEMSQQWLALQIGSCTRTVRRHLDTLVEIGFLKKKFRYKGKGKEQTNLYTVNPAAKTDNFLNFLAPYFHEVRLYLERRNKERLRRKLDTDLQEKILEKQAINQNSGGVVLPFNNPFYLYLTKPCTIPCTMVEHGHGHGKKGESMVRDNQIGENSQKGDKQTDFRSDILKNIQKALGLTIAGTIELSGYTDEVLSLALQAYRAQRGQINKVFNWFVIVCASQKRKLNSSYDGLKVRKLQEQYNVHKDSPKRELDIQLNRQASVPSPVAVAPESYVWPDKAPGLDKIKGPLREVMERLYERVKQNTKPVETTQVDDTFKCTCHYRKKFNPDYVCYGMKCPIGNKNNKELL